MDKLSKQFWWVAYEVGRDKLISELTSCQKNCFHDTKRQAERCASFYRKANGRLGVPVGVMGQEVDGAFYMEPARRFGERRIASK